MSLNYFILTSALRLLLALHLVYIMLTIFSGSDEYLDVISSAKATPYIDFPILSLTTDPDWKDRGDEDQDEEERWGGRA